MEELDPLSIARDRIDEAVSFIPGLKTGLVAFFKAPQTNCKLLLSGRDGRRFCKNLSGVPGAAQQHTGSWERRYPLSSGRDTP